MQTKTATAAIVLAAFMLGAAEPLPTTEESAVARRYIIAKLRAGEPPGVVREYFVAGPGSLLQTALTPVSQAVVRPGGAYMIATMHIRPHECGMPQCPHREIWTLIPGASESHLDMPPIVERTTNGTNVTFTIRYGLGPGRKAVPWSGGRRIVVPTNAASLYP
jgi:hypothetical protein